MPRNDYQKIANAFLDLWQEQVTRALNDSQFYDTMMAQMRQPFDGATHDAGRPSAAPQSPVTGDAELDAIRQRLADSEARISELERELRSLRSSENKAKSAARSSSKPRKRAVRKVATKSG
jgi:hypothetical protein